MKKICKALNTENIGLIYVFVPDRMLDMNDKNQLNKNGIVFKLHHYYSLLMLTKLFKPTRQNRLLFYYVNDWGKPISNHYNRWLNDTDWNSKLPLDAIKFIKFDYNNQSTGINFNFDFYDILTRIKQDSLNHFDLIEKKKRFLLVTSDVIIGPKIQSCFTKDLDMTDPNRSLIDVDSIRASTSNECFNSINKISTDRNFYSFLYKLDALHNPSDFSGILIWNSNFTGQVTREITEYFNVYKCNYKNDIFKTSKYFFNETYCVFGFELNIYEAPILQDIFFDKENYFYKMIRSFLYGDGNLIEYKKTQEAKIPNVVHLIWFGSPLKTLKFIEYLCLKSILSVIKPDKIRIHGDNKPFNCTLWQEISKNPKIEWMYRERPDFKYGQDFSASPIQHLADVARLEVLYEEGGIYSDFDILWVKPVDKFRYMDVELIASNDITSYCYEFPFNIQIGAFLAPAKSEFVLKWLNGYREKYHLFPGDYVAVSMCEPYKLFEKEPQKVFIDNRLQMIFFNGWSSFIPRYSE